MSNQSIAMVLRSSVFPSTVAQEAAASAASYVFSGVRPSSAPATSARCSGSDFPNATGSPCVSAPEDGRTPVNTSAASAAQSPHDEAQQLDVL